MSNIRYTIKQGSPEDVSSFKIIEDRDQELVNKRTVESTFNTRTDKVEAHFYSLDGTLLQSFQDFTDFIIPPGRINKEDDLAEIRLNPEQDVVRVGFENGDVNILYNFLRRKVRVDRRGLELFIEAISPDRTEIRAILKDPSADSILEAAIESLKQKIEQSEFIEQFILNFKNNNLLVGLNIDSTKVGEFSAALVKLYQPLPDEFEEKNTFTLEEIVSDSVLFEVESEQIIEEIPLPSLRGPNFDVGDIEDDRNPTEFLTLSELLVENSLTQAQALIQQKGIELGIDYANFENFIFFSSAKERVENFLHKASIISGSNSTEEQNVINKFDHFERYLLFTDQFQEKDQNTQNAYLEEAELYDELNFNKLTNSIPSYILEDSRNLPYLLFVDMVAQHFDNIWIYTNAVTDRYKADNRLEFGISKDLVKSAVESLGVNLYRSSRSVESLFSVFEGETYNSGSEVISGSIKQFSEDLQPVSKNDYLKEVYKRVYHNIPLLLKSKGTERGLRSLINCFGIPDNILDIKVYENTPLTFNRPDQVFDFTTSSLDRIKIQDTGSILGDNTLSVNASIQTYDTIYDENLSTVEIGFSPTDNVNAFISGSGSVESIDDLIGDPSDYSKASYRSAEIKAIEVLGQTTPYNIREFIRLIKFYDNALFRIVQEFIPARTDLVSGIVIKPHILERSKRKGTTAKWVRFFPSLNPTEQMDFSESEFGKNFQLEGELQISNLSGADAGVFPPSYNTSFTTPDTIGTNNEQARFNGELSGSLVLVSDGELNDRNKFKLNSANLLPSDRFETSDYDVLYANVSESRRSTFREEFDSVLKAPVQDSNYSDTGWTNARYEGTQTGGRLKLGDYPAIRLTPSQAVIFESGTPSRAIAEIRLTPIEQLDTEPVFFATFSRSVATVGMRQREVNRDTIRPETFFTSNLINPRLQTFVFRETEDGKLQRVSEKRIFFASEDILGTTDANGKIIGRLSNPTSALNPSPPDNTTSPPDPDSGFPGATAVFITSESETDQLACTTQVTSTQIFISPPIIELTEFQLVGKKVYENSDFVSGSEELENPFTGTVDPAVFGISYNTGDTATVSITLASGSNNIVAVVDCTSFFGSGGGSAFGEG